MPAAHRIANLMRWAVRNFNPLLANYRNDGVRITLVDHQNLNIRYLELVLFYKHFQKKILKNTVIGTY
jgi:hypothetical protein